jgi:protein-disulfide isomerase
MSVVEKRAYAILTVGILVAAYFLFSIELPHKLEFTDRLFPQGFRGLVLDGAASKLDPLYGFKQVSTPASRLNAREVCDALFQDPTSPSFGSPDSQLQIVAFLDYRCPYCKKLSTVLSQIRKEKIRIVYKEWPILGESSVLAANASLAADKQGKYLEFHARLMNSRLIPTIAYINEIAVDLGINKSQLLKDMNSEITAHAIEHTSELASALGLVGTPALVIGRTIIQGEISRRVLERLIDDEVGNAKTPCLADLGALDLPGW